MPHLMTIQLGVVMACERAHHGWQSERWKPVSVVVDAPPQEGPWRELTRGDDYIHFHAATLPLQISQADTMAYQVNLSNGEPSLYVVLRDVEADDGEPPIAPAFVTASPFEAQKFGENGLQFVERVAMPDPIIELIQGFICDDESNRSLHLGGGDDPLTIRKQPQFDADTQRGRGRKDD